MRKQLRHRVEFDELLRLISETPAEYFDVAQLRNHLRDVLGRFGLSSELDKVGNLYATRPGGRPGHVLLCAHIDKNLRANRIVTAPIEADIEFINALRRTGDDLDRFRVFLKDGDDTFHELPGVESGPEHGVAYRPRYFMPRLRRSDGTYTGTLDDAIGVALILDVLDKTDPREMPTVSALFTAHEEFGLLGAEYAAQAGNLGGLSPDEIMVIDVCPRAALGSGVVLYRGCGAYRCRRHHRDKLSARKKAIVARSEPLVERFREHAQRQEVPTPVMRATSNDAFMLARHTGIPTVALELPIENMHGVIERIALTDVANMKRLIETYVTRPLEKQRSTRTAE